MSCFSEGRQHKFQPQTARRHGLRRRRQGSRLIGKYFFPTGSRWISCARLSISQGPAPAAQRLQEKHCMPLLLSMRCYTPFVLRIKILPFWESKWHHSACQNTPILRIKMVPFCMSKWIPFKRLQEKHGMLLWLYHCRKGWRRNSACYA